MNSLTLAEARTAVGGVIAFSPGGVLIHGEAGKIRGAIGISGDNADCDEACARAGVVGIAKGEVP